MADGAGWLMECSCMLIGLTPTMSARRASGPKFYLRRKMRRMVAFIAPRIWRATAGCLCSAPSVEIDTAVERSARTPGCCSRHVVPVLCLNPGSRPTRNWMGVPLSDLKFLFADDTGVNRKQRRLSEVVSRNGTFFPRRKRHLGERCPRTRVTGSRLRAGSGA